MEPERVVPSVPAPLGPRGHTSDSSNADSSRRCTCSDGECPSIWSAWLCSHKSRGWTFECIGISTCDATCSYGYRAAATSRLNALAEIAAIVREATETREAPFCVSADIRAAYRLVKLTRADRGHMCCKADSSSETIWVNRTGTFGISSAPYWWSKLAGLIGRFVGYLFHQRWMMHMI